MEENDLITQDLEFKRYLQILRPYLGQLTSENVIIICNAWIQRLSDCSESEKVLRNKYAFSLCYQLAKGILEEPFLSFPPTSSLIAIPESENSDDSSTEIEYAVVNADGQNTEVLFSNKQQVSDTEYLSQGNEYTKTENQYDSDTKLSFRKSNSSSKRKVLCYAYPEILKNYTNYNNSAEIYEYRAKNLIKKLREIKTENMKLQTELVSLKEESLTKSFDSNDSGDIIKVNNTTSAFIQSKESSTTLKSLKFKLQEVQESRNSLIDKIGSLQEQLDNINEIKLHEIEEIEAKYKLETIDIKTKIREEIKDIYENKIEDLKINYESKMKEIENKFSSAIQDVKQSKDDVIEEKNKTIALKDLEINNLKSQIDELKIHLHSVLEKFIDKPVDSFSGDNMRLKAQEMEKRFNKMQKNKIKYTRVYEAKLAQLQREKHLAECSLQLQVVKQRAQLVNEVTDENQIELTTALDKLEVKYKEIVANVQATAIQRRVQDQITLESILQAACSIPRENITQGSNQFLKNMRNQNESYDSEMSPLLRCNKANKSFGEENVGAGYCSNDERMGELFERVYIPQRDNCEAMK